MTVSEVIGLSDAIKRISGMSREDQKVFAASINRFGVSAVQLSEAIRKLKEVYPLDNTDGWVCCGGIVLTSGGSCPICGDRQN